ncbi:MAG: DNA-primase RepB domain-containing protein [Vicinamibacterales bacterium]
MPPRIQQPSVDLLRIAFAPGDWVAVFLKSYVDGQVAQRVASVEWVASAPVQAWLRAMNAHHFNVYVSVNAFQSGSRNRRRDCVATVRHVFLEADADGDQVLGRIERRSDLPSPSYVLHSSPNRVHVFWRVRGFTAENVETLQRRLAAELRTDSAATPVTQNTRLPGFFNYKHADRYMVWVEYRDATTVYTPGDFPCPSSPQLPQFPDPGRQVALASRSAERASLYLERVPPAIAGQHGDVRTFQVCCRLVRGFALTEDEALTALAAWNARCQPPWTEAELRNKLRGARQYGREPVGGLL